MRSTLWTLAAAIALVVGGVILAAASTRSQHAGGTVLGVAFYLPMLGLGTLIRGAAGAISLLFVLLLIVPILLPAVDLDLVAAYLPGDAGANLMRVSADEPYVRAGDRRADHARLDPGVDHFAGYLALRRRDA
ncbi:hypothetical protein [Spongiactinospora sp. TRM90649]|uniref:hypothetical protein n=1 Tax=Spongiactinospora sp. TRM90649 TaxID=3031114 RepID=UPI0023F8954F|nr:hypothetical protein [Spongiactinospora sp. TRM90649]MDF5752956.1 hypothetical protein [Spongiactinospora sp. TRM90649]